MFTRSLLTLAISALSIQAAQAAPFMPMDARGLAMGNTGVASAKRAHAPAYNPSLLSQAHEDDDFSLLFPQIGLNLTDEHAVVQEGLDINDDIFPRFEELVSNGNQSLEQRIDQLMNSADAFDNFTVDVSTAPDKDTIKGYINDLRTRNNAIAANAQAIQNSLGAINNQVSTLESSLRQISDNPISARLGVAGGIAFPGKSFAAAVYTAGTVNFSANIRFSEDDLELLGAYTPAAEGFVNEAQNASTAIGSTLDALDTFMDDPLNDLNAAKTEFSSQKSALQNAAGNLSSFSSAPVNALGGQSIITGGGLSSGAEEPNLSSTAEVVGVGVVDVGVSFSREFDIAGHAIAFGITPKIQKIFTFHYGNEMDNFDEVDSDTIDESRRDYTAFNLDFGASYRFGSSGNWLVGAVVKNLLGGEYDYADTKVVPVNNPAEAYILEGGTVKLNPQLRGGIAYQSSWFNAALDLDLIENDPVAYEAATQYASFGVELDAFGWLQLRAGYRTNLSASGMDVVSAGFGISPFDVVHFDLAAMANPSDYEKEAGVALEMGLNF